MGSVRGSVSSSVTKGSVAGSVSEWFAVSTRSSTKLVVSAEVETCVETVVGASLFSVTGVMLPLSFELVTGASSQSSSGDSIAGLTLDRFSRESFHPVI